MKKYIILLLGLLMQMNGSAWAQDYRWATEEIDGKQESVMILELSVSPQKLPEPALEYPLAWGFDQRSDSNAAAKYNLAVKELTSLHYRSASQIAETKKTEFERALRDSDFLKQKKDTREAFEKTLTSLSEDAAEKALNENTIEYLSRDYLYYGAFSREEFPMEKAAKFVSEFRYCYNFIKEASRCERCDWEYEFRNNTDVLSLPLPDLQECRLLAFALRVKAKWEIYQGKYAEAVETIRVGKAMARHVAQTPIIVAQLAGRAIDEQMNSCLYEFMQQKDAPNLYWSLTALPSPYFPVDEALTMEMDWVRIMIPELAKAMDSPEEMSDAQWKSLDEILKTTADMLQEEHFSTNNFNATKIPGVILYPHARLWLIEQGRSVEEVDRMPSAKVIGLWSVHRYRVHRDQVRKLISLPYWQLKEYETEFDGDDFLQNEPDRSSPLGRIASCTLPGTTIYMNAMTRTQQTHELLRILEALRYYAAEQEGRFPEKLEEIRALPIPPFDPYTGKPYDYRLENDTAVIRSRAGYPHVRVMIKMER